MTSRPGRDEQVGVVYLLHFDRPLSHARHRSGWTVDLADRVRVHRDYPDSPMMRALKAAGIGFTVARVWEDCTTAHERGLKNGRKYREICPVCTPGTRRLPELKTALVLTRKRYPKRAG